MACDLSVLVRSFRVSAPNPVDYTEVIPGRHGAIRMGRDYGPRQIMAVCEFYVGDASSYSTARQRIYDALFRLEPYHIIADEEPEKRWTVEADSTFTPSRVGSTGEFTIPFISNNPFAELIDPTLEEYDIQTPILVKSGGSVDLGGEDFNGYSTFDASPVEFSVWNHGNITLDPRNLDHLLKITVGVEGAQGDKVTIQNETTGDTWKYEGALNDGDTIILKGVRSMRNGLSVVGSTNRELISLAPGENVFSASIEGYGKITFDFNELYM
nr:phage tail family protein [Alteribacter populi]